MESRSRRRRVDLQMQPGPCPWRSLTALGVALTLAGCAGEPLHSARRAPLPSSPPQVQPASPPPPAVPELPWDLPAELAGLRPAGVRSGSQHLAGDLEGEVLVNAEASSYPKLGPTRSVERAAVLVQALRGGRGAAVKSYFAMRKREPGYDPAGGDWEYAVAPANGVIELRGRIGGCARCHADAPHDHLFGPDRR